MKICNKCTLTKDLNSFYYDKRLNRGYKSICKDCENYQKKLKRTLDWKKENQPISLFISAFKKRFGSHKNFTNEFIELYKTTIKLKSSIKNKESNPIFIKNNFVCRYCGAVEPIDFPIEMSKLIKASDIFLQLHKEC